MCQCLKKKEECVPEPAATHTFVRRHAVEQVNELFPQGWSSEKFCEQTVDAPQQRLALAVDHAVGAGGSGDESFLSAPESLGKQSDDGIDIVKDRLHTKAQEGTRLVPKSPTVMSIAVGVAAHLLAAELLRWAAWSASK